MAKFKQYLLENADIKSAKAKSKGLKHVSFNLYRDTSGQDYIWDDTAQDFQISTGPTVNEQDIEKIHSGINAPFVQPRLATLGGHENRSIITKISLDPKESWANNIYENSRNAMFSWNAKGEMTQANYGHRFPIKFRKTKAKSVDEFISKVNAWIAEVNK